jgi:hypothetical protein
MSISANSIKMTVTITNWPFLHTSHTLGIVLENDVIYDDVITVNQDDKPTFNDANNLRWLALSTGGVTLYAEFVNYGSIDGSTATIQNKKLYGNYVVTILPYFMYSAVLDPNYAVLADVDNDGSSNAETGGHATPPMDEPVLVATIASIVGVALIIAAIIFVLRRRVKSKRRTRLTSLFQKNSELSILS